MGALIETTNTNYNSDVSDAEWMLKTSERCQGPFWHFREPCVAFLEALLWTPALGVVLFCRPIAPFQRGHRV